MAYVPQTGVKKAAPNGQTLVNAMRKPLSWTKNKSPTTSLTSDSKGANPAQADEWNKKPTGGADTTEMVCGRLCQQQPRAMLLLRWRQRYREAIASGLFAIMASSVHIEDHSDLRLAAGGSSNWLLTTGRIQQITKQGVSGSA
ncbi:hypothetical protein KCU76_g76, partial [Aureobasidium melanogenum]